MPLTNENYFSPENQLKYMGVSQFKAFEKCPAAALAEITGNFEHEQTTALLVGSYVDAHFEGTLDVFKSKNPQLFKRDGGLKADYIQAEQIIQYLENDDLFVDFMSGKKQVIMTGTIEGVEVKIKIDSYIDSALGKEIMRKYPEIAEILDLSEGAIVDLKIVKDFEPIYVPEKGRLNWIEAWEYDLQGAVYQEVVRQNIGKVLPFFIVAGTKEKSGPDKAIIEIPQSYLDVELDRFRKNVQFYDAIKKGLIEPDRCEHCAYCKATKVLTKPISLEELDYE